MLTLGYVDSCSALTYDRGTIAANKAAEVSASMSLIVLQGMSRMQGRCSPALLP
jgi:hypothetical protein